MGRTINLLIGISVVTFVVIFASVFVILMVSVPAPELPKTYREVPEICKDVQSTEAWLYDNVEECLTVLYTDLYQPCFDGRSKDLMNRCIDEFNVMVEENCRALESTMGIKYQVCIVHTLKELYKEKEVSPVDSEPSI